MMFYGMKKNAPSVINTAKPDVFLDAVKKLVTFAGLVSLLTAFLHF